MCGIWGCLDGFERLVAVGFDRVMNGVWAEKEIGWHAPLMGCLESRFGFRVGCDADADAVSAASVGVVVFFTGVFWG